MDDSKISQSFIDGVVPFKNVSGVGYVGIGLWTSLCKNCADFFGVESRHVENKITRAKNRAFKEMQAAAKGADGIMCVSVAMTMSAVLVCGMAYKYKEGEAEKQKIAKPHNVQQPIPSQVKSEPKAVSNAVPLFEPAQQPSLNKPQKKFKIILSINHHTNEATLLEGIVVSECDPTIIPEGEVGTIMSFDNNIYKVSFMFNKRFIVKEFDARSCK